MHASLVRVGPCLALVTALLAPRLASADEFEVGSFIIPMDTDYQDEGMLRAYGLVYALLSNDVPVRWVIASDKVQDGADFSAAATDVLVAAKGGNPDAIVVLGLLPDGDLGMPLCGAEAVPAPRKARPARRRSRAAPAGSAPTPARAARD